MKAFQVGLHLLLVIALCSCSNFSEAAKWKASATDLMRRCEALANSPEPNKRQDAAALLEEGCFFWADFPDLDRNALRLINTLRKDQDSVVRNLAGDADRTRQWAMKIRQAKMKNAN